MHHAKDNVATGRGQTAGSEAARLVNLCSDQLKAAIDEALCETEGLSIAVLDTARHASALLGTVTAQKPGGSLAEEPLLADSNALQQALKGASTRLQFADRLVQRLSNVSNNLRALAELMQSTVLPIPNTDWSRFLEQTRSTFTMEQERQMFDAIFDVSTAVNGADPVASMSEDLTLFDGDISDDG